MKALITGSGGQVGRAIIDAAPAGTALVAATHADLDIRDRVAVSEFVGASLPDLIISAAAYTAVDKAETEPELAHEVNAVGAGNLATAAREAGARMIQLSTDFVFDGESPTPYAPDAAPSPLGVYGVTKLAGEQAVLSSMPNDAIVLRTAWVYAPKGQNFLLTMLHLMRDKGSVQVVSDQTGTPTSAASIAEAIWALAAKPDLAGIYHWTDSGIASWHDFAIAIAEVAALLGLVPESVKVVPVGTEDYPTLARRPHYSVLDCRSTVDAIGIEPRHWRDNLRHVLGEITLG